MRFSIITPVYQVEKYIRKCIESVLSQSYTDFEFIIVDDGSKDECPRIIDEYSSMDNRIQVIHKPNGGLVSARKAGAKIAKGDYIIIVDSDDWVEKDLLYYMNDSISKTNAEIVCCGFSCCYENGEKKVVSPFSTTDLNENDVSSLCQNNIFDFSQTLWAKAIKRELYFQYQMKVNDSITMGEDGVVIYSLLPKCQNIAFVNIALYNYRICNSSITRNKGKVYSADAVIERVKLLKSNLSDIDGIDFQIATYACHAYFNSCLSYFRNYPMKKAKKLIQPSWDYLARHQYFNIHLSHATRIEKIARILLKHKMFGVIKIISSIRR